MGFDLTGYEKDSIKMSSFTLYTVSGIAVLIIVILLLSFYFFIERERIYKETVLQGGVEKTTDFKNTQMRILSSYGNKGDDGVETSRIPINEAIENAVDYYND
mgnify:FL=1